MDSLTAFFMGEAHRNDRERVFDWNEAARRILATGAKTASAGLSGDWEYTGGCIFADGVPLESSSAYLASTWARPELELDDGAAEECWIWLDESPGWNAQTLWPQSALDILAAN